MRRFLQAGWLVHRRELGRNGIKHLHAHFAHTPAELGNYVSMMTGLTFSISAHAKDIYTSSVRELRGRINRSEFLMTCTGFNYNYLRSRDGIFPEKIHNVYHGINTELFRPSETVYSDSPGKLRLITVARLVPKKGYPSILRAQAQFVRSGIPLHYDVYGKGDLLPELQELVRELALRSTFIFMVPSPKTN